MAMALTEHLRAHGVQSQLVAVCQGCLEYGEWHWMPGSYIGRNVECECMQQEYGSDRYRDGMPVRRRYTRRRALICPDTCILHRGEPWAYFDQPALFRHVTDAMEETRKERKHATSE